MTYRSSDVQRLTGATRRQLDYWRRVGIVRPGAATPGGHNRYTEKDLRRVTLLVLLTKPSREGWKPISMRKALLVLGRLHHEVEGWIEVERATAAAKAIGASRI